MSDLGHITPMRVPARRWTSICLAASTLAGVAACGLTESSVGVLDRDGSVGAGGSGGVGGGSGSAGIAGRAGDSGGGGLDAGEDARDGSPDAPPDAEIDAEIDAGEDAGDAGCIVTAPDPTQKGPEGPSCGTGSVCGSVSCCENLQVPGGTYDMGRSTNGTDAFPAGETQEVPEHAVSVSTFHLDRFEVTVGRLRNFVDAYDGTPPASGAGAHPAIAGSGWQDAWNAKLPSSKAALTQSLGCSAGLSTWTDTPGPNEQMAANCMSWYVAFAFCVWDGGRLPTEAEWEMAAAGAQQNRLYPWGPDDPEDCRAVFAGTSPHTPVGSRPAGAGRWGHSDLGGGVWEWVLDYYALNWYSTGGQSCSDCANLSVNAWRVVRGAGWSTYVPSRLRSAYRAWVSPETTADNTGFRCAR